LHEDGWVANHNQQRLQQGLSCKGSAEQSCNTRQLAADFLKLALAGSH
jgi:hypothetical protein